MAPAVLRLSVSPEDLAAMMRSLWFGAAAGKADDRHSRRAAECHGTGGGMDVLIGLPADELERFLTLLQPLQVPGMVTDVAEFPADAMRLLAEAGALTAPLPIAYGGLGLGTERHRGGVTPDFLDLLRQASLPTGRQTPVACVLA